jgi:O-antigen/teichoic acid export membrane protein
LTASLIASFVGSLVLGFGFSLVSLAFGHHFVEISGTIWRMVVFTLGVALSAATMVFDDATIGLMRGGLQLSRNVTLSIAKMLALPASALVLHDAFGVGIMWSWILGTAISFVPTAITIKRGGTRIFYRPDWATFWRLGKVTLAHNWLNLALTVPGKLVPVITAALVAPSSNAAYYIAAMISSFLFMVPMHLSTVLFAIASATPEKIAEKLRFVLRTCLIIGVPAGLVIGLTSHYVLSVFGSSYATLATGPLWILIAGYIPGLPSVVYIAVCRATGRIGSATILLSTFAVLQMAAVLIGGKLDGLYGLSYGQLAVAVLEAFITTPPVLRAAFGSARVRAAAEPTTAAQARLRAVEEAGELRLRQEAGIAALIALATASTTSHRPSSPASILNETRSEKQLPSAGRKDGVGAPRRLGQKAKRALSETSWWPDIDEATFEDRQETGMAALIAVATHAARF